jgi:hypothetical protein
LSAKGLLRILWLHNMIIVPRDPTPAMVEASLDAVKTMGVVTREQKHRGRLSAALQAGAKRLWPHLFEEKPSQ